jgi:hypothetical protein
LIGCFGILNLLVMVGWAAAWLVVNDGDVKKMKPPVINFDLVGVGQLHVVIAGD